MTVKELEVHRTELNMRAALDPGRRGRLPSMIQILKYIGDVLPEEYEGWVHTTTCGEKPGLDFEILRNGKPVCGFVTCVHGADFRSVCRWLVNEIDRLRAGDDVEAEPREQ